MPRTSNTIEVIIDHVAPAAPTLLDLSATDDTGVLNSDNITQKTSGLTINGSGETGATVTLFDDANNNGVVDFGESLGTTTVSGGTFSRDIALGEGTHNIRAIQTDLAGNTSAASTSDALDITVDTTPPGKPSITSVMDNAGAATGAVANGAATDDTTPTLAGSAEANTTVTILDGATVLGTTTADGGGAWTFTLGALSSGAHSFTVTATDAAGNTSTASNPITVTIDQAPVLALANATGSIGDDFQGGYFGTIGSPNLWTTNWTEVGDDGLQNGGDVSIRTVSGGAMYLRLTDTNNTDDSLQRTVNLSSAASATLSFDYQRSALEQADDKALVQISTDGVHFTTIAEIGGGSFNDSGFSNTSIDISSYISPTTTIRFVATAGLDNFDGTPFDNTPDLIYIDNVNIAYTKAATFTENGASVAITGNATIADPDDTQMSIASVMLTNKQAGDQLLIGSACQVPAAPASGIHYVMTMAARSALRSAVRQQGPTTSSCRIGEVRTSGEPSTVNRNFR